MKRYIMFKVRRRNIVKKTIIPKLIYKSLQSQNLCGNAREGSKVAKTSLKKGKVARLTISYFASNYKVHSNKTSVVLMKR